MFCVIQCLKKSIIPSKELGIPFHKYKDFVIFIWIKRLLLATPFWLKKCHECKCGNLVLIEGECICDKLNILNILMNKKSWGKKWCIEIKWNEIYWLQIMVSIKKNASNFLIKRRLWWLLWRWCNHMEKGFLMQM
jgi:hypothetical protein